MFCLWALHVSCIERLFLCFDDEWDLHEHCGIWAFALKFYNKVFMVTAHALASTMGVSARTAWPLLNFKISVWRDSEQNILFLPTLGSSFSHTLYHVVYTGLTQD